MNIAKLEQNEPAAFSRIDLLAVISAFALLAILLTPALARTRVNDQVFQCLNNHRQLAASWSMYAEDHENALPNAFQWALGVLDYVGSSDNTNVNLFINGQMGPYIKNPAVYKCPADQSTANFGAASYARVRSISMSQMFRTSGGGQSPSPPWRIYGKTSDMVNPAPSNLWVMLDENPDSINDGAFAVIMGNQGSSATWGGGPSTLHNGGCNFSFADGHAQIKEWTDPRTLAPPMKTTYTTSFPFGVFQPNNPDIQWVQDRTSARQ